MRSWSPGTVKSKRRSEVLNKVKIAMLVGVGFKVVSFFFPELPMPEGAQDTIVDFVMLLAMFGAFWKTSETKATLKKLIVKG